MELDRLPQIGETWTVKEDHQAFAIDQNYKPWRFVPGMYILFLDTVRSLDITDESTPILCQGVRYHIMRLYIRALVPL